ncbi:MAG TPA: SGNH/GDSL hydrolase family protein [Burkholderiales bacterium]|nr:SGNH/GDSL hydrolase family protein [Burkholderiales bacterium]
MLAREMKGGSLRQWTVTVALALTVGAPGWSVAQAPGGIVVFGTSLSDPGNAFALQGVNNTPPDYLQDIFMVPNAPYARGGHHLSNGATWIEQLARPLGLAGSVGPAFKQSGKATNYAVAGTRAWGDGINISLEQQVDRFLYDLGDANVPADWLFVVEIGSNDVRDALVAYLSGTPPPHSGDDILQGALTAIGIQLQRLYGAGATRFLIWSSVPNIGSTPAVRTLDYYSFIQGLSQQGQIIQFATWLSYQFSVQLGDIVTQVKTLPGVSVAPLDVFTAVNALVAQPQDFGLTNVTMPCITPNIAPFTCQNPDEYLFWDGVHPTQATHAIFAQKATAALIQMP